MMTITRRVWLESVLAGAAAARWAPAQEPVGYREYARCLPDYLEALALEARSRRNARIDGLTSGDTIRQYQTWARETFVRLAGGLPERTPLRTRVTGGFERDRYRVENLIYVSQPNLFVTANLYVPKQGNAPFPGVLVQMGHSPNGKSYAYYQRCCQGLAQLGYVVLAFDPMGQGERTNYPRRDGWLTRLRSPDDEHSLPGKQMLLVGETATRMQVWDAVRSLDVLASHPQVDARRLGSTGQSGGGTLTMMLAAIDDRLAAAAVSSGNTENYATSPYFAPGSTDDAEQNFIGSGAVGFDRWDLLWPFAPKPLLVAASARDFFGTYSKSYEASGREEFARLKQAYSRLGAADRVHYIETPLPHGFSYSLRVAVYNWFERWLKHSERSIDEEPPTSPESDQTLWCGKTGNTARDFNGTTPYRMVLERANAIHTAGAPADLRALLRVETISFTPRLEVRGRTRYGNCEVSAVEVNTASKVWVPAWLFSPKTAWKNFLIIVEPNGRNGQWHEDDLYPQLAATGIAVCAADVRGVGDLEPQFSAGAAGYAREHQNEENYAWAALILGRSLLGQRTADLIGLIRALRGAYPQATLSIAARDKMTIPALCAAALESPASKVYLSGHLVSWRSLVETEEYSHPLVNFVPDILRSTDLPYIARLVPGLVVAGGVDATGAAVPIERSGYADYREQPAWDLPALRRFVSG